MNEDNVSIPKVDETRTLQRKDDNKLETLQMLQFKNKMDKALTKINKTEL